MVNLGRQEETLRDKGIRLTWRRQAILDIFRSTERHLSAEDVLMELKGRKVKVNVTTVYRNLEMVTREGLLRHVDFHDDCCRYELSQAACHHHLHCRGCGKVIEFGECEIAQLEALLAKQTDFTIERHHLELYGLCPDCR